MRYQVPQFVDIEDKIFGPLTLKQFIYILGGGGMSVIAYLMLPFFLAAPLIGIAVVFAGSLAFYKVNNKPFIEILQAALQYNFSPRLYLWKKEPRALKPIKHVYKPAQSSFAPTIRKNNLTNMAFNLSVEDKSQMTTQQSLNKKVTIKK